MCTPRPLARPMFVVMVVCCVVHLPILASADDIVLFRDDFNGTMAPGWTWIRQNSATWSLTGTALRIELEYGDLWENWTNNCRNLLVRAAPDADTCTIETHLSASLVANINQALIVLYGNDDNYLRFGLLKLSTGLYVNHVHEIAGSPQPQTSTLYGNGDVYLRIRKTGSSASMFFSSDGWNWQQHAAIASLNFTVSSVGLVAFDGSEPASASVANYDYFQVTRPSPATGIEALPNGKHVVLHPNRPNPFTPLTTIPFTLPEKARVRLSIYTVEGRLVRTLVDEVVGEGYQERVWDGKDGGGSQVGSGVYFYRLTAGNKTLTKKMVLLK
jgi:hypothetical protein